MMIRPSSRSAIRPISVVMPLNPAIHWLSKLPSWSVEGSVGVIDGPRAAAVSGICDVNRR